MTHQPARSFAISFQNPFNRADGRTSNVRLKMISKQKSRRVTVGNTRFRHKVSTTPKSKGIYRLNITAQSEDHNGSKLVVEGLIQKDISVWPLVAGSGESEYYPTVTRHEAEWCIREAINHGWDYSTSGPNFILQASNEIFRLGFWTTERAKNPICQPIAETETKANKKTLHPTANNAPV